MKKLIIFLFFIFSFSSLAENFTEVIEINIITKNHMKIYYISFSEATNSFRVYDELY